MKQVRIPTELAGKLATVLPESQTLLIGHASRLLSEAFERELSPRFEGKILEHLDS